MKLDMHTAVLDGIPWTRHESEHGTHWRAEWGKLAATAQPPQPGGNGRWRGMVASVEWHGAICAADDSDGLTLPTLILLGAAVSITLPDALGVGLLERVEAVWSPLPPPAGGAVGEG